MMMGQETRNRIHPSNIMELVHALVDLSVVEAEISFYCLFLFPNPILEQFLCFKFAHQLPAKPILYFKEEKENKP